MTTNISPQYVAGGMTALETLVYCGSMLISQAEHPATFGVHSTSRCHCSLKGILQFGEAPVSTITSNATARSILAPCAIFRCCLHITMSQLWPAALPLPVVSTGHGQANCNELCDSAPTGSLERCRSDQLGVQNTGGLNGRCRYCACQTVPTSTAAQNLVQQMSLCLTSMLPLSGLQNLLAGCDTDLHHV